MTARTAGFRTGLNNLCRRFFADRAGNIAMTAAVVMPVLLAAIGVSIDYVRLLNEQRHLQDAIDSAAVAAAASLVAGKHTDTTVKDYATNFVLAGLDSELSSEEKAQLESKLKVSVTASKSGSVKTYAVKITGGYTAQLSPFANFIGYDSLPIAAVSTTQSQSLSKNAMSMYLVLDRSGSMSFVTDSIDPSKTTCQNYTSDNWRYYPYLASTSPCYFKKMAALKKAAVYLFDELDLLEKKDTTDTVVRVGGVSFNDKMQTPQTIAWGTSSMRTYVSSLPDVPTGGTDMSDGMAEAYKALSASSEASAHTTAGNTSFSKFILLMTDGENTGNSSNWNSTLDKETLASCEAARSAGMTIYAVAFMAPARGETLLKACAGVTSNYYSANDMTSLIAAFAEIGAKATKQSTRILN